MRPQSNATRQLIFAVLWPAWCLVRHSLRPADPSASVPWDTCRFHLASRRTSLVVVSLGLRLFSVLLQTLQHLCSRSHLPTVHSRTPRVQPNTNSARITPWLRWQQPCPQASLAAPEHPSTCLMFERTLCATRAETRSPAARSFLSSSEFGDDRTPDAPDPRAPSHPAAAPPPPRGESTLMLRAQASPRTRPPSRPRPWPSWRRPRRTLSYGKKLEAR